MHTLLLLHGALGSEIQLEGLQFSLSDKFDVHTLNFHGHGGAKPNGPFRIETFAHETCAYLDRHQIPKAHVFGYSMGGYVALFLAKNFSNRVQNVITLATKLEWNEAISAREIKMLNPEIIEQKIPQFAKDLRERHAPQDWKQVMMNTADMMLDLGQNPRISKTDLEHIYHKTLLMIGDKDKMVSIDETLNAYRTMPNASLSVLPHTSHAIELVDPKVLCQQICQHLSKE